jgi:adenosylcobinamide-GDP ribazoletransferase
VARPLFGRDAIDGRPAPLAEVRAAVAFLTRFPIGDRLIDRSGAGAFGLVGAGVGLVAAVPFVLLGGLVPFVGVVAALIALALLSGALHLDGLADTADALVAVGPDAAERARKDPAAGPGGVVAIVAVLGLEATGLAAVLGVAGVAVAAAALVACVTASRSGAVLLAWLQRGSAIGGLGAGARFSDTVTGAAALITAATSALVVGAALLVTGSLVAAAAGLGSLVAGVVLGGMVARLRRQLDGDGFGASVEVAMAVGLAAGAIAATLAVGR